MFDRHACWCHRPANDDEMTDEDIASFWFDYERKRYLEESSRPVWFRSFYQRFCAFLLGLR